ncbi:MAG: hypothetical protein ACPKPY_06890 [Nitrososphaeraceae archaeon]
MDSDNFIIKIENFDEKDNPIPYYSICILANGDILAKNIQKINLSNIPKSISKIDLNKLIDEFIDIYFFAMKDKYIQNRDISLPCTNLSIKWQKKYKKIIFDNSSDVPPELIELKKLIEQILCIEQ